MEAEKQNHTREPAVIDSVLYDEERGATVFINCKGRDGGWGQGFGGFHLKDDATRREFVSAVCAAFGVADPEMLIGEACFVLRNFDTMFATVVGLESQKTGRRFIAWEWCAQRWPSNVQDPLSREIESLKGEIAWAERRKQAAMASLKTIHGRYVDWRGR